MDGDFALLAVELAPNRATVASAIPLPLIEGMDFTYHQQFRRYGDEVWLPVDYRASVKIKIGMVGLHFPLAKFNAVTRLADYQVNVDLPDTLYAGEEVLLVDSLAVLQDSTFTRLADKVPLSGRERAAYAAIDSTMHPALAFKPTGFLARFVDLEVDEGEQGAGEEAPSKDAGRLGQIRFDYDLRYDRVEGAHVGLSGRWGGEKGLGWRGSVGYGLALERWSYRGGGRWKTGSGGIALDCEVGTASRYRSDGYTRLLNSGQSLLGVDDYFDYYWSEGLRGRLFLALAGQIELALGFALEEHTSLQETTAFNLLDRDWEPRPNPAIAEGRLRSVEAGLEWGGPYRPFGLTANRHLALDVEHSGAWLGSAFSFTSVRLVADGHFKTFLKRRFTPNALDLRLVAGYSSGDVPVQRLGSLEASMGFFSPFGVLRSVRGHPYEGEHYLALYWEHNFKTAPFEALGLWDWALRGTGLVVHGASGRTWIGGRRRAALTYAPRYLDRFHHEVGVSLVLYHLVRLDCTRRLDRAAWSLGLSLARFDFATD